MERWKVISRTYAVLLCDASRICSYIYIYIYAHTIRVLMKNYNIIIDIMLYRNLLILPPFSNRSVFSLISINCILFYSVQCNLILSILGLFFLCIHHSLLSFHYLSILSILLVSLFYIVRFYFIQYFIIYPSQFNIIYYSSKIAIIGLTIKGKEETKSSLL